MCVKLVMLFVEKFSSLTTFWSNQLHLSKLNGELGSYPSDLSLNCPNFPCPFCTKIFDEKAEVFEHFCHDTFVSDEEVENHNDNLHSLYDSLDFQRKG